MTANADSLPPQFTLMDTPFDPRDVVTTDRLNAYMDEGRPMLNNYIRHAKIGEGHHGEVYLCYQTNPGLPIGHPDRRVPVAMKSVKRDNVRDKQFKKLRQHRLPITAHTPVADRLGTMETKIRKEIAIMKKCRHPHVVRLYEIIDDRMRDKVYMVMEYLGGGEVKWRDANEDPILTLSQTRRIIRDAVLGLEYLHHQGIIHRDIKPANLLWTEDRRQVKIADFGTSHFSRALLLAGGGEDPPDGDAEDPILLDDSELLKRDGTPKFLAPEMIYEHSTKPSGTLPPGNVASSGPSSIPQAPTSQSLSPTDSRRPPITEAIDVWALGVTLYCLLFGKTPYEADQALNTEWSLYHAIVNDDWNVEETMGADRISTGGRRPIGQESEGAMVVQLLSRFLEKDPQTRVTLEEVKRNRWLLRDLAEPEAWLQLTKPRGKIDVSVDDTSDATSSVRFRWNWGVVSRRISSLFRRSRDPNENAEDQDASGAVTPEPSVKIKRKKSSSVPHGDPTTSFLERSPTEATSTKRDKGKQRADQSSATKSKGRLSKSIERWPASPSPSKGAQKDPASLSTSAIQEHAVPSVSQKGRRGSATTLLVGDRGNLSSNVSTQSSPTATIDKPRARFAFLLNSISHWRPNRYSPQGPLSTTSSTMATLTQQQQPASQADMGAISGSSVQGRATPAGGRTTTARRSEEVLRYYRTAAVGRGALTNERRVSSWGQGDQPPELEEVPSFSSACSLRDEGGQQQQQQQHQEGRIAGPSSGGGWGSAVFGERERLVSEHSQRPLGTNVIGGDEDRRFGPPCFDEDSSTIASAFGNRRDVYPDRVGGGLEWRDGVGLDDDEEEEGGGGVSRFEDGDNEDDDDDDDDDVNDADDDSDAEDPDEVPVTFSPRKRAPPREYADDGR